MFSGIPLLTLAFSTLNITYMYFTQFSLYDGFVQEASIKTLLIAYFAWTLMAFALKKFVVDSSDFGYKSVFTSGPLLGLLIYICINVTVMSIEPDWSMDLALSDVLWGTGMFGMVTLFALMFKAYL
jgi:uncharacterized membrane protein